MTECIFEVINKRWLNCQNRSGIVLQHDKQRRDCERQRDGHQHCHDLQLVLVDRNCLPNHLGDNFFRHQADKN